MCAHPRPLSHCPAPVVHSVYPLVLLVVLTGSLLLQLDLTGDKQYSTFYDFQDLSRTFQNKVRALPGQNVLSYKLTDAVFWFVSKVTR